MAFIPVEQGQIGGAVVTGKGYVPSAAGSLIYLNGGEDLAAPLGRIKGASGTVELHKTKISDEIGYMAIFHDTEGNRVALHSMR